TLATDRFPLANSRVRGENALRGPGRREEHHRIQPRAKGAESLPKAHHLATGTQQVLSRSDGGVGSAAVRRAESALLLQAMQGARLRLPSLPGPRRNHPAPGDPPPEGP